MLIGKLSELTCVSRKAIRHYESIDLIPSPERIGSYRNYSEDYIPILKLIKQAQLVGFSLSELREVVSKKSEDHEFPVKLACELIDKKIFDINLEVDRLNQMSIKLEELKEGLEITFKNT